MKMLDADMSPTMIAEIFIDTINQWYGHNTAAKAKLLSTLIDEDRNDSSWTCIVELLQHEYFRLWY